MRSAQLTRLTRQAAIRLALSMALVLAGTCLVLRSTVWNGDKREAPEPFYTELPGVDLSGLSESRKKSILKRLNVQRCPCECMRSVASCRVHHGCPMSLAAAREALR